MKIPIEIKKQLTSKKLFFDYNGNEWKLEIEKDNAFLENIIEKNVLIFANDGFGNYLFLKENSKQVYEFFHETSEIFEVEDSLGVLIGAKKSKPSKDNYPKAIYETGEEVLLDDKVKFKVWIEFWKGWQNGKVIYVPGISNKKNEYENSGLKEIGIKGKDMKVGVLVYPETGIVKNVKFIERCRSRLGKDTF